MSETSVEPSSTPSETAQAEVTPFGHIDKETLNELYELRRKALPPKPQSTKEVIVSEEESDEPSNTDEPSNEPSNNKEAESEVKKPAESNPPTPRFDKPLLENASSLNSAESSDDGGDGDNSGESDDDEDEDSLVLPPVMKKSVRCPLCGSWFDFDSLIYHLGSNEICTETQEFTIVRKIVGRNYQRNLDGLEAAILELEVLVPNKRVKLSVKKRSLENLWQRYSRFSGYTRIIGIDKGDPFMFDDELLAYESRIKKIQRKIRALKQ